MNELSKKAAEAYARLHGEAPDCVSFAPGRVEILGNHTDYNGGYVLSVALDLGISIAAGVFRDDPRKVEIWSEAFPEPARFSLDRIAREEGAWANYPKGVLVELQRAGVPLGGFRMAIVSSLPLGAGISSSAALELATAEAAYGLFGGRPKSPMEEAKLCQRAEASFAGVPCGLLDQYSSRFGKKDHALFLDCATLRNLQVPFGRNDLRILIADTGEKHALVDGQYAALRESCERAARTFDDLLDHDVRFLRDVTPAELKRHGEALGRDDLFRAEHVIFENERVLHGLAAIRSRQYVELKRLMLASHASSRDLLGNSTPALDFLVEAAASLPGFFGGKLSGGGFGGSTVNLVEEEAVEDFTAELSKRFEKRFSRKARWIETGIGDGAMVERSRA
jgi:galactokinase